MIQDWKKMNNQSRNSIKYDKENTKRVFIKLNKNTDKDILDHLDSIQNKQGYIKELIRKDMKPRQASFFSSFNFETDV